MPQTFSSLAHLIREIGTKFIIFKQNRSLGMWKYHQFVEIVKFIFWTFGRFLTVWTHSAPSSSITGMFREEGCYIYLLSSSITGMFREEG